MVLLVWDASALAKRYSVELGSEVVDALFRDVDVDSMATTVWGIAETFSILVRKRNGGRIGRRAFDDAVSMLDAEVVKGGFTIIPVPEVTVIASLGLIETHHLNSTDSAILLALIDLRNSRMPDVGTIVSIASDARFLRAAEAEGFATVNPETTTPDAAVALLASL